MVSGNDEHIALIDAVEAALRPLLPLFRHYAVAHHDLSQMLARLFVYDTAEILREEGHPTTAARLALMTGLTRGEVEKHLVERSASLRRSVAKTAELLAPANALTVWNSDPRFSTPYGAALDLPLKSVGRQRSFEELVSVAAPDVDPEAVLDQLVAARSVEVAADYVRCTNRAYIPTGVSLERIAHFGTLLSALSASGAKNLLLENPSEGYFERCVESDFRISDEGRFFIREWLMKEVMRVLEMLDAFISSSRDRFELPVGRRVGVDCFMYDVPEDSPTPIEIRVATN